MPAPQGCLELRAAEGSNGTAWMNYDLILPPRLLCAKEAARFVNLSSGTLAKHRCFGTGPVYSKIGGRVVYSLMDLQLWVARGARTSTRQVTGSVVNPAKPRFRRDQEG